VNFVDPTGLSLEEAIQQAAIEIALLGGCRQGAGGELGPELGGWIYRDAAGNYKSTNPRNDVKGKKAQHSVNIKCQKWAKDETPIIWFHCHPPDDTVSKDDKSFARDNYGLVSIVYNSDGSISIVNPDGTVEPLDPESIPSSHGAGDSLLTPSF
jgi:hypothetical protein